MKLYKVLCRGMQISSGSQTAHGIAFVVADDPELAYRQLRDYLDRKDIGYEYERELESVELIADCDEYPDCGIRLFIPQEATR